MSLPSDQDSKTVLNSKTPSARALISIRDKVLSEWMRRVREDVKTASKLQNPILIDTLPLFIDNLAQALAIEHPRLLATESNTVAQEHGSERARVSKYGPDQLIQEYQILKHVIEEELSLLVELTTHDLSVIQKSINAAIQEAMVSYFVAHSRIREQFVATLTHDLRNPLTAMRSAAELILLDLKERKEAINDKDISQAAARIVSSSKRADRMIQDLLDASVLQLGEQPIPNIAECEILNIIQSVINEFSEVQKQRIRVVGPAIKGFWDCSTLERAIENIVNNAFKYGFDASEITIKTQSVNGRAMVSVHNLGNPVPPEHQSSLFQAFHRTAEAKASGKKGWGLGLALSRATAEAHGGSLAIDSSAERGTTFTFDIPVDARPFQ